MIQAPLWVSAISTVGTILAVLSVQRCVVKRQWRWAALGVASALFNFLLLCLELGAPA